LVKSSRKTVSNIQETQELRLPNPAWAWEHLRRNPDYRAAYRAAQLGRHSPIQLYTGCFLIRETRRWLEAEKWGLLRFANPDHPPASANVFWDPSLLAGALSVKLSPIDDDALHAAEDQDEIILSQIKTRRVALDTIDGERHYLLGGDRFWIQLRCKDPLVFSDSARVGVRIAGMKHFKRRLDTAAQLLSLYQSSGNNLSLIGRNKNSKRLADGLNAFDIVQAGGSHKDVAVAVYGEETVMRDWAQSGSYLEDATRRLIYRANHLVKEGYRGFLTKKNI